MHLKTCLRGLQCLDEIVKMEVGDCKICQSNTFPKMPPKACQDFGNVWDARQMVWRNILNRQDLKGKSWRTLVTVCLRPRKILGAAVTSLSLADLRKNENSHLSKNYGNRWITIACLPMCLGRIGDARRSAKIFLTFTSFLIVVVKTNGSTGRKEHFLW